MSHWDPQPYPDYPRPSGGHGKLVLGLLVLGLLAICLFLGAGVLIWRRATAARQVDRSLVEGPAPLGKFDSLEAKYAAAAAAFNGDSVGVSGRGLKSIAGLFDAIVAATRDSNNTGFAQQVDARLLLLEMRNSGVMPSLSLVQERLALTSVEQGLYVPVLWTRYKIARVEPHASGKAAIVYGYFWDLGDGEYRVRWWIVRRDDGWKVYDWELLDYGVRASKEMAIYYTYGGDPRLQRYLRCKTNLAAADKLMEQGSFDGAAQLIRLTEPLIQTTLSILTNDGWLQIGNAWMRCGRMDQAMAFFRRIEAAEAQPGAIFGQALCQSSWGRHEKALQLASRYEALLGRGPAVNRLQGESLLALGRLSEAVVQLQKALDVEPGQMDLLPSLGLALADEKKGVLADYVTRTADPAATALSLAESLAGYGDPAALEAVSRAPTAGGHRPVGWSLAKTAPDPATEAYLAGLAREIDADYAAAGESFKQAFSKENDAGKKQKYVRRYLEAMISAGQFVEGYLGAPDRAEAFKYLADCYTSGDYHFPRMTFAKLLDAHRRSQPEDPWLYYYTGIFLAEREAYDEAGKQYLAGMAKTQDEEVLAAFRYPRVWALYAAGKGMQAYQQIGPAPETFRQLAGYYRWQRSLDPEKAAELKALVEVHRATHPDEPWLDFCAGIVAQHEKDYDEADRLFARGQQAEDPEVRSAYRERRLDARIESGEIDSVLEEIKPPGETFVYLARRLSAGRKWPQLKSLIEAYRRLAPASPEICRWEVELLWQHEDYEGVIRLLAPWPAAAAEQLSGWEASELSERLVRSYLRLKRTAEATAAAEAMYERGESMPLILTSSAQGDVEKTSRLLRELLPAQYLVTSVYDDEDVGPIVRGKGFLPLRMECPPGLRFDLAGSSVVVLFNEARQPDAGQLRAVLAAVLGPDLTLTKLPTDAQTNPAVSLAVSASGQIYGLTFGSDRYRPGDNTSQSKISSPALQRVLKDHRGWLAIGVSASNPAPEKTQSAAACRLTAGLLDDGCLAVYFGSEGRLIPVEPATRDRLQSVQSPEELSELGEEAWLLRDTPMDEAVQKAIQRRRQRLKEFCSAFTPREPQQELFVKILLRLGQASEPHWLAVRRIVRGARGSVRLVGQFVAGSLLAPEFQPGEPICVELYDVIDWKSKGQEKEPSGDGG